MPRHAGAGIPEAWLADVAGGAVTVFSGPGPDGYADRRVFRPGEEIASTAVAGLQVTVDEIVGPVGDRRR
jgi:Uma2 family endonuclease